MTTIETQNSRIAYIPVKVGRGGVIHAAPVGTKAPVCLSIAGHYSAIRGEATITCKRCLSKIEAHEAWVASRTQN